MTNCDLLDSGSTVDDFEARFFVGLGARAGKVLKRVEAPSLYSVI